MTQLARIGAVVEQRQGSEENLQDDGEKSKDEEDKEEEGSKDDSRESQKRKPYHLPLTRIVLVFILF